MYNCMFVSALPDPTCNSEKSANGGNKQILLLSLLLLTSRCTIPCLILLNIIVTVFKFQVKRNV